MRSVQRNLLILPLVLALTGCAGSVVLRTDRTPCSQLISDEWKQPISDAADPVERPELPADATWEDRYNDAFDALKDWIGFGVDQTKNLKAANGRTRDVIGLQERCEKRDADADKKAKPKVLGFL